MQTKTLLVVVFILLLMIGGVWFVTQSGVTIFTTSPNDLADNLPAITEAELAQGWYFGELDQKKPGTPGDWVHSGAGTRSAKWSDPTPPEPVVETPPATTTPAARGPETVIGTSAGGQAITAYHFGTGPVELLFIGGIHGGYSYNTTLVAYELIDHLQDNPDLVPANVTVTVIPAFNADGLMATVKTTDRFNQSAVPKDQNTRIAGRFNKNAVDLNRNFDCEWKPEGIWQSRKVSGGSAPFSEPEAAALRAYVEAHRPRAVVGWYSAAGGVYASNCGGGVSAETTALMNTFAEASGYNAYRTFDFYEITGDMMNWFAKEEIPAISVLLTTHEATEWEKNRAGIEAVIARFAAAE